MLAFHSGSTCLRSPVLNLRRGAGYLTKLEMAIQTNGVHEALRNEGRHPIRTGPMNAACTLDIGSICWISAHYLRHIKMHSVIAAERVLGTADSVLYSTSAPTSLILDRAATPRLDAVAARKSVTRKHPLASCGRVNLINGQTETLRYSSKYYAIRKCCCTPQTSTTRHYGPHKAHRRSPAGHTAFCQYRAILGDALYPIACKL